MIQEKMQEAINDQINAEIFSAYLYLSMSAYFQNEGYTGFAKWMELQAAEEFSHARKFYNYIYERGGRVTMKAIEAPETEWSGILDVFEATLKHEQKVTELINNLVDISMELKDHASFNMLQWFVTEQVEEEATAEDIINKLKMLKDHSAGLFMMDKELGSRVLNPAMFQGM